MSILKILFSFKSTPKNILLFSCLFVYTNTLVFANNKIDKIQQQIKNAKKYTQNRNILVKKTSRSLDDIYNEILKERKEQAKIQAKIDETNTNLLLSEFKLKKQYSKRDELINDISSLRNKINILQTQIENAIVDGYAKSLGLQEIKEYSLDEIVNKEVYDILLQDNKEQIYKLNRAYLKIRKKEIKVTKQTTKLKQAINVIKKLKQRQLVLQKKQNNIIVSLQNKKQQYKTQLDKQKKAQLQAQQVLSDLNILEKKTIQKERLLLQKKQAFKIAKQKINQLKNASPEQRDRLIRNSQKVKNRGSSISRVKIARYKGAKTIAPLKHYRIIKNFGKNKDKLYNTQLFEESIQLTPLGNDKKVRAIFSGSIAYIKHSHSLFGNIVIIKHGNSLHSVYSQLSSISKTISKNKRVRRGDILGVSGIVLKFQVLQNGKYVDPKSVFR